MSSALGRACSGAARRLAASQRLGGAFAGARGAVSFPADRPRGSGGSGGAGDEGEQWKRLRDAGEKVNPCNSPLHPAVKAGTVAAADAPRLSVQAAYDPRGMCFGCGAWVLLASSRLLLRSQHRPFAQNPWRLLTRAAPRTRRPAGPAHPDGLRMSSYRTDSGLQTEVSVPMKYQARRRRSSGSCEKRVDPALTRHAPRAGAARRGVARHSLHADDLPRKLGGACAAPHPARLYPQTAVAAGSPAFCLPRAGRSR